MTRIVRQTLITTVALSVTVACAAAVAQEMGADAYLKRAAQGDLSKPGGSIVRRGALGGGDAAAFRQRLAHAGTRGPQGRQSHRGCPCPH